MLDVESMLHTPDPELVVPDDVFIAVTCDVTSADTQVISTVIAQKLMVVETKETVTAVLEGTETETVEEDQVAVVDMMTDPDEVVAVAQAADVVDRCVLLALFQVVFNFVTVVSDS